jgi:N6-adenosine-specific RNA methylase IME4/ParB-like chromosome segregation protein Spo0J
MLISIAKIKVSNNRREVDEAKILELADSIKTVGLINPITISTNNDLIAGAHRLLAYKQLGLNEIESNVVELTELQQELIEIDENLIRNELHYTERGEQLLRRKAIYEELHPQSKHGMRNGQTSKNEIISSLETKSFADEIADKINVSARTIQQEIQIAKDLAPSVKGIIRQSDLSKTTALKLARLEPEMQEKAIELIIGKDISLEKALKDIKLQEIKSNILTHEPKTLTGSYDIIYADPPWKYEFSETSSRSIEAKYPTMTIDELKDIMIPADDNAVLLLWATAPLLKKAIELMEHWGFIYRTCAVWDKQKFGTGYWFRGQHELLLVGVKGEFSPPQPEARVSSVFREVRTVHSKKPDYYYGLIESMFPNCRYIEMFARTKHSAKWDVWGNQI